MLKIYKIFRYVSVLAGFIFGANAQGSDKFGSNPFDPPAVSRTGSDIPSPTAQGPVGLNKVAQFAIDFLAGTFGGITFGAGDVSQNLMRKDPSESEVLPAPSKLNFLSNFISLSSALIAGAGTLSLLSFVPSTIVGGLITAAAILFGGTIIECTTKNAMAWSETANLEDSFSIWRVFVRHIAKSMGIGVYVFLAPIPYAIVSALAVYTVVSLVIFVAHGPSFVALISPFLEHYQFGCYLDL